MRPVYVCQLTDEMQREIRGILTRLLLYQCGTEEKAEKYWISGIAKYEKKIISCLRADIAKEESIF